MKYKGLIYTHGFNIKEWFGSTEDEHIYASTKSVIKWIADNYEKADSLDKRKIKYLTPEYLQVAIDTAELLYENLNTHFVNLSVFVTLKHGLWYYSLLSGSHFLLKNASRKAVIEHMTNILIERDLI